MAMCILSPCACAGSNSTWELENYPTSPKSKQGDSSGCVCFAPRRGERPHAPTSAAVVYPLSRQTQRGIFERPDHASEAVRALSRRYPRLDESHGGQDGQLLDSHLSRSLRLKIRAWQRNRIYKLTTTIFQHHPKDG